jgi:two-component system sensor histidine kinase UhpB
MNTTTRSSKAFFFATLLLFLSHVCRSQDQNKIDSLLNALKQEKIDTSKINLCNALSNEYNESGNYSESNKYSERAIDLSHKNDFKKGEAEAYNNLGVANWQQGNFDTAMKYYSDALKLWNAIGFKEGISISYSNIGILYHQQGKYTEALTNYMASIKLSEEIGDTSGIAYCNNNIAGIYDALGKYEDGIRYQKRNIEIGEKRNDKKILSRAYNNIGIFYRKQKKFPEALEYLSEGLKINKEIGRKYGIAVAYNEIGNVYLDQDIFQEALTNFLVALKIEEEIGDNMGIAISNLNIGGTYLKLGNYNSASKYFNNTLVLAAQLSDKELTRDCYKAMAELDSTTGSYRKAYEDFKMYTVYKDSLLNETNSKQIEELKAQYETEKKDKEIIALSKNQEINSAEIKKQTLLKNSLLLGIGMVALLFFFIYNNFRTKQKLKLENIRNNIAADLHDDIGSTLNSISLFSEVAKKEAGKEIPALKQIGVSSRKIIDAMSDIVWTINPDNDNFENVIERMRSNAYLLLKAAEIDFNFKADESLNTQSLPMHARKNVYLIFKESTNNIVKYSKATRAMFHVTLENKNIKMVIRDNGIGFDMANAQMGNGIKNIKRRATEIGGQLTVDSSIGNGTSIELSFKI